MTKKLLMGNEAMAHAALEAGVAVVAGYPGTPSSEIVETVARQRARGAAHGVHVEWSTNEKVALELLFGASLAGKRGLFTCKQMGLNVASDALMSLNYVSVRGGLVLIVADDPGPISSQTEQDTRRFAAFAKVPVLDPASPEQAFDMVKAAFDLSERFHTPVIVRPTTRVDHASTFLDVADETTARIALMSSGIPGAGAGAGATGALAGTGGLDPFATGFQRNPDRWVIFPRRAYEAHGEINARLEKIAEVFSEEEPFTQFNPMFDTSREQDAPQTREEAIAQAQASRRAATEGARSYGSAFGIIASGISAAYAREALRIVAGRAQQARVRMPAYRFLQVGTPYPFPERTIAAFTKGLSDILVIEELDYVIEDELMRFAGRTHAPFTVHGKLSGEARTRGENDVDDVTARIERFLGLTGRLSLFRARAEADAEAQRNDPNPYDLDRAVNAANLTGEIPGLEPGASTIRLGPVAESGLPARPPVLCAGCPHRGAFHAVKQALGDTPAVMCGDIGCYTLGNAAPLNAVDTCLCMGGGVTMAQGIAVADPDKKAVAYIGDSTFFASGMTGLANAAYNGHDITVMVLDNATTAMTGAQPHPGTGWTLMGERSEPLDIEQVLIANGFTHVYHANPFDVDASTVAARAAIAHEGPSAVVFEGACARLVPAGQPAEIDTGACTGCKRCVTTIGCPAIGFNSRAAGPRSADRGQATINADLCVGCNLCTQVCPFKAILPGVYEQDYQPSGDAGGSGAIGVSGVSAPLAADPAPPTVLLDASGEIPAPVQPQDEFIPDNTQMFAPVAAAPEGAPIDPNDPSIVGGFGAANPNNPSIADGFGAADPDAPPIVGASFRSPSARSADPDPDAPPIVGASFRSPSARSADLDPEPFGVSADFDDLDDVEEYGASISYENPDSEEPDHD